MTKWTTLSKLGPGLTIWLVLGLAPVALAEDAPGAGDGNLTSYDFEDDLVQGDLVRPNGEVLQARRRGDRISLIRVREHFIDSLLKSVENI